MRDYIQYAPTPRTSCRVCRSQIQSKHLRVGHVCRGNAGIWYHVNCYFYAKGLYKMLDMFVLHDCSILETDRQFLQNTAFKQYIKCMEIQSSFSIISKLKKSEITAELSKRYIIFKRTAKKEVLLDKLITFFETSKKIKDKMFALFFNQCNAEIPRDLMNTIYQFHPIFTLKHN